MRLQVRPLIAVQNHHQKPMLAAQRLLLYAAVLFSMSWTGLPVWKCAYCTSVLQHELWPNSLP